MSSSLCDQNDNVANWLWLATSSLSFLLVLNEWFAWSSCKSNSITQAIYTFFSPPAEPVVEDTSSLKGAPSMLEVVTSTPIIHVINATTPLYL